MEKQKEWPSSPRALSGRLRRAAGTLRKVGIEVTFDREPGGKRRIITIVNTKEGGFASQPSQPSQSQDFNGIDRDANCDAKNEAVVCVTPTVTTNPLKNKACDGRDGRDANSSHPSGGTRTRSDDLAYHGPVVTVPDLGPDPLDEHGGPVAATATNGGDREPWLTQGRVRDLARWYVDQAADQQGRASRVEVDSAALDAGLRQVLAEEVPPEFVEQEFERVMAEVFRV